jgi:SAM-dependent methyltransferase
MPERRRAAIFHELAPWYDLLSPKEYRDEAAQLSRLARRYGRSGGRTWLDVACGTGQHLEHLRRTYEVTGVDLSGDMLRIARRRLPRVPLVRGDMRTFRLGREFDVVTCLFSAIGHLDSDADLRRAFANFRRHLAPGGVAIVEPWIAPAAFRDHSVHLVSGHGPGVTVARMAYSRRRGRHSTVTFHFLVGREGRGIERFVDVHRGLLVAPDELVALMEDVGLRARFLKHGFPTGRGLLIAQKPRSEAPA